MPQQEEIQTICPRNLTLNLSDADVKRISETSGRVGLTVAELLQNFIGDLVHGTYSNGSDERMYANQWFNRCWFAYGASDSLLQKLLKQGEGLNGVERFLAAVDDLFLAESDLADAEDDEERQCCQEDIAEFKEDVAYYTDQYPQMTDLAAEVEKCRQWVKDLKQMKSYTAK